MSSYFRCWLTCCSRPLQRYHHYGRKKIPVWFFIEIVCPVIVSTAIMLKKSPKSSWVWTQKCVLIGLLTSSPRRYQVWPLQPSHAAKPTWQLTLTNPWNINTRWHGPTTVGWHFSQFFTIFAFFCEFSERLLISYFYGLQSRVCSDFWFNRLL